MNDYIKEAEAILSLSAFNRWPPTRKKSLGQNKDNLKPFVLIFNNDFKDFEIDHHGAGAQGISRLVDIYMRTKTNERIKLNDFIQVFSATKTDDEGHLRLPNEGNTTGVSKLTTVVDRLFTEELKTKKEYKAIVKKITSKDYAPGLVESTYKKQLQVLTAPYYNQLSFEDKKLADYILFDNTLSEAILAIHHGKLCNFIAVARGAEKGVIASSLLMTTEIKVFDLSTYLYEFLGFQHIKHLNGYGIPLEPRKEEDYDFIKATYCKVITLLIDKLFTAVNLHKVSTDYKDKLNVKINEVTII